VTNLFYLCLTSPVSYSERKPIPVCPNFTPEQNAIYEPGIIRVIKAASIDRIVRRATPFHRPARNYVREVVRVKTRVLLAEPWSNPEQYRRKGLVPLRLPRLVYAEWSIQSLGYLQCCHSAATAILRHSNPMTSGPPVMREQSGLCAL